MSRDAMTHQDFSSPLPSTGRVFLVGTFQGGQTKEACLEYLDELESLADTYGFTTVGKMSCPMRQYDPATFLGKGKVQQIRETVEAEAIDAVVFDDEISPQQQKNLEKIFCRRVMDRTELILGIFSQRARTKEARIQTELAQLRYQLPRLRRMWTHLSRQRSGGASGGFVKGEGEKQIEIDRRIIRSRITQLQKNLEEMKKQRKIQKHLREKRHIPTFALVGYTNVGKSTLLQALTHAKVLCEDRLFATLDPTTRKYTLPNHQSILLVDTVGFIRKIPHQLVAAFKSTLEEVVSADILLHLIDISHPSAALQAEAALGVLKELGAHQIPILTILNKIDACSDPLAVRKMKIYHPKTYEISALTQEGFDRLFEGMMQEICQLRKCFRLSIPQSRYQLVSELMREGKVLSCEYEENQVLLEVEIPIYLEKKVTVFRIDHAENSSHS